MENTVTSPSAPQMVPPYGSSYYPMASAGQGNFYPAQYFMPPMVGQSYAPSGVASLSPPKRQRRHSRPGKFESDSETLYDSDKFIEGSAMGQKPPEQYAGHRDGEEGSPHYSWRRYRRAIPIGRESNNLGENSNYKANSARLPGSQSGQRYPRSIRSREVGRIRIDQLPSPYNLLEPITLRLVADPGSLGQVVVQPGQIQQIPSIQYPFASGTPASAFSIPSLGTGYPNCHGYPGFQAPQPQYRLVHYNCFASPNSGPQIGSFYPPANPYSNWAGGQYSFGGYPTWAGGHYGYGAFPSWGGYSGLAGGHYSWGGYPTWGGGYGTYYNPQKQRPGAPIRR